MPGVPEAAKIESSKDTGRPHTEAGWGRHGIRALVQVVLAQPAPGLGARRLELDGALERPLGPGRVVRRFLHDRALEVGVDRERIELLGAVRRRSRSCEVALGDKVEGV